MSAISELVEVVARLRGETGCPWDRKQTVTSLRPYLVEECYELLDAMEDEGTDSHKDELGDVLLQVLLQSQICEEHSHFGFDDVARNLKEKLIRRHPHVFGTAVADTAEDVVRNWQAIKAVERKGTEKPIDESPSKLPALPYAQKVQERASRQGFDWSDEADVMTKIREECGELEQALASDQDVEIREEIGDLLFAVVNLCRFRQIDAEGAMRAAVHKFVRRYEAVVSRVVAEGGRIEDYSLAALDAHWDAVKATERQGLYE